MGGGGGSNGPREGGWGGGAPRGGGFGGQDGTQYAVPADKCGLVIGKGSLIVFQIRSIYRTIPTKMLYLTFPQSTCS